MTAPSPLKQSHDVLQASISDLKVLHDRVDYKNFLESLNKKSP